MKYLITIFALLLFTAETALASEYTCQIDQVGQGTFELFTNSDTGTVTIRGFVYPAEFGREEITWSRCTGCTNPEENEHTRLNRMTGVLTSTWDSGQSEDRYGNIHPTHRANTGICRPATTIIN